MDVVFLAKAAAIGILFIPLLLVIGVCYELHQERIEKRRQNKD